MAEQTQVPPGQSPQPPDWKASLPAEYQQDPSLAKFQTPADLFKSYSELSKLMGHDKIALPRKTKEGTWDPEDTTRFYEQLGRPKEAKAYEAPKDVQIEANHLAGLQTIAHKANLMPAQFEIIAKEVSAILGQEKAAQDKAAKEAFESSQAALRQKWGNAYEQNAKLANAVLQAGITDKAQVARIIEKLGNDPDLIEVFATIGTKLSEDSLDLKAAKGPLMSPQEAKQQISTIMADPNHPYFKAEHPDHKFWVEKVYELNQMAAA